MHYRVECAPTRLLTRNDDTKYSQHNSSYDGDVWMISKCEQKSSKESLKELCEKDSMRGTLESITPVSVSSTTYKNKFCAYCNNVGMDAYLQNWKLELYCDADLSSSTSSLVATVIQRKCNFFYIPPENAPIQKCRRIRKYLAESQLCAVTAAAPLFDFGSNCNTEYQHQVNKGYICTSCYNNKTAEQQVTVCGFDYSHSTLVILPPFSAILDLAALPSNPQVKGSENCDPTTQFKDDKLVSFIAHN